MCWLNLGESLKTIRNDSYYIYILFPKVFNRMSEIYLEPQTTIDKWLFQLDDSQSLHRKWLEITISIHF